MLCVHSPKFGEEGPAAVGEEETDRRLGDVASSSGSLSRPTGVVRVVGVLVSRLLSVGAEDSLVAFV